MFRLVVGAGLILAFLSYHFFHNAKEREDVSFIDRKQGYEAANVLDEKNVKAEELQKVSKEQVKNSVAKSSKVNIKEVKNHHTLDEPYGPKPLSEEEEVDLKNFVSRSNSMVFLPLVINKLYEMNISKKKRNQVVKVFKDYHSFQEKSKDEFKKFLNKKYGGYDVAPSIDDWAIFHNQINLKYRKSIKTLLGEKIASEVIGSNFPFGKNDEQLKLFQWKPL